MEESDFAKLTVQLFETVQLPRDSWGQLWTDIFINEKWRGRLQKYALLFAARDLSVLKASKLIAFQGPPGTGKTSLAKGYANFVAQQLQEPTRCLQVNAESWRSHWLGEPAKLVARAFQGIRMSARHANTILLVDELETIAIPRSRTMNTTEPSDVITAVSELLTQIDRLQELPNVLVIVTTNLANAIDEALLDRVDLIVPFNLPDQKTRLGILENNLGRLRKAGLKLNPDGTNKLSVLTEGFSGRDLSKLPMRAITQGIGKMDSLGLEDFVGAIEEIKAEHSDNSKGLRLESRARSQTSESHKTGTYGNSSLVTSEARLKINYVETKIDQLSDELTKLEERMTFAMDHKAREKEDLLVRLTHDVGELQEQTKLLGRSPGASGRFQEMESMLMRLTQELEQQRERIKSLDLSTGKDGKSKGTQTELSQLTQELEQLKDRLDALDRNLYVLAGPSQRVDQLQAEVWDLRDWTKRLYEIEQTWLHVAKSVPQDQPAPPRRSDDENPRKEKRNIWQRMVTIYLTKTVRKFPTFQNLRSGQFLRAWFSRVRRAFVKYIFAVKWGYGQTTVIPIAGLVVDNG